MEKWSSVSDVERITVSVAVASMNARRSFDMKADFRGDVHNIPINCPKCKGRQGVRRKDSLVVRCFVCGTPVSRIEVQS